METWTLDHPKLGHFAVHVGSAQQLHQIDAGYPLPGRRTAAESRVDSVSLTKGDTTGERGAEASDVGLIGQAVSLLPRSIATPERHAKWRQLLHRDDQWRPSGLVLTHDGTVLARERAMASSKIALTARPKPDEFTTDLTSSSRDRVEIEVAAPSRFVTGVRLRRGTEVVAFDPPAGSPGAQRAAAMEASPWKRVAYPLLTGLSKAGWAVWVLIIGPLIARVLAWIISPVWRWISEHMPHIDWPTIPLPDIHLPSIPWPHIHLPTWNLPQPPGWIAWLLEHPKVWMPIVAAVFFAFAAVRNNKKSKRAKAKWDSQRRQAELARVATVLAARQKQLSQHESR